MAAIQVPEGRKKEVGGADCVSLVMVMPYLLSITRNTRELG